MLIMLSRAKYYRHCISHMLKAVGVPTEKLTFVLGSSYQKSPEYVMDVYKMCSVVSEHEYVPNTPTSTWCLLTSVAPKRPEQRS